MHGALLHAFYIFMNFTFQYLAVWVYNSERN